MDCQALYDTLLKQYTSANLNQISSWIISVFKAKQVHLLEDLSRLLPAGAMHPDTGPSQIFTRLMMLYHPDRLSSIRNEMSVAVREKNLRALEKFRHISETLNFIQNQNERPTAPVQKKESASSRPARMDTTFKGVHTFLSALKQKEYGNLDVVYHDADLENIEGDLELSGYQLRDLDGLQLCQNLTGLDLSHNRISDIWALSQLRLLEELNLSSNHIGSISALESLSYLRILDLSENDIEEIQSLYNLEHLEFVNLIGNPVQETKIHPLQRRGVIVVF